MPDTPENLKQVDAPDFKNDGVSGIMEVTKGEAKTTLGKGDSRPPRTLCRYEMCGDRILFEDFNLKKQEKIGRIYMANGKEEELAKAKVIAIGPDVKTTKLNDVVIIVPDLGTHLKDGDKTYRVLPENSVMAIDYAFNEEEECEPAKK